MTFFVQVGPRVAAELAAQGPPPSLPQRLPRVGACAFHLHPISVSTLHNIISRYHEKLPHPADLTDFAFGSSNYPSTPSATSYST